MKAPADQFYFSDYMRDTRELSLAARGAWMDCLCKMWFSVTRGQISMPLSGYARLFGCTLDQARAVVEEIREYQIGDAVTEANGNITLTNRRIYREWKEAEANKNRQSKYREKQKDAYGGERNGKITPPSISSSSSALNTEVLDASKFDFPLRDLIEAFPDLNITPAQCGMIEAAVESSDRFAWAATISTYKANCNRATNTYIPEKVGNLLNVFKAEKEKLRKKENGFTKQPINKTAHVGKNTMPNESSIDLDFCAFCHKGFCSEHGTGDAAVVFSEAVV